MSSGRSRIYYFKWSDSTSDDYNSLCKLHSKDEVSYMAINKKTENEKQIITGVIRFKYTKTEECVLKKYLCDNEKIILSNTVNKKTIDDIINSEIFFEYGKYKTQIPKEKKKKITMNDLQQQINNLQTLQMEQKDKIIEEQSAQFKQVMDVCLSLAKNMPSIETHTNSHNKVKNKFNLNFFLNEQCKDAVNLIDFVKGIQLEMKDMLLHNQVGFAEAISQIFIKSMGNMDLTQRPIHCTDLKRETLYVRNDSQWCNDGDKKITDRAIETLTNRNYGQMKKWKDENPDYLKSPEKNREYIVLTRNMMGGSSDKEQDANTRKIIHNIAKATHLDKEVLKNNIKKKPDKTIENTTIL
jgi:hypothetical protein